MPGLSASLRKSPPVSGSALTTSKSLLAKGKRAPALHCPFGPASCKTRSPDSLRSSSPMLRRSNNRSVTILFTWIRRIPLRLRMNLPLQNKGRRLHLPPQIHQREIQPATCAPKGAVCSENFYCFCTITCNVELCTAVKFALDGLSVSATCHSV